MINADWYKEYHQSVTNIPIWQARYENGTTKNIAKTEVLHKFNIASNFSGSAADHADILVSHSLTIHDVEHSDAGEYSCVVEVKAASETVVLKATHPASLAVYGKMKVNPHSAEFPKIY